MPLKFIWRYIIRDIEFPHPIGIVIGGAVNIGKNCVIYQNVTLGSLRYGNGDFPTISDEIKVYAGAVVVGNVIITKDVWANSLIKPNMKVLS
jgi:serine O-acetyltransferase